MYKHRSVVRHSLSFRNKMPCYGEEDRAMPL